MAPIFVGSNDDNSRVRSDRVGFAISTSNPGSASEGDAYYNSSDSQLNIYDGSAWASAGAGGNSVELTASGSISDGQPVIIKSDGTVAGVATVGIAQTFGSAATFESGSTNYIDAVYDSSNKKVVIAYSDYGDGQAGKAVVATITGNTITYGTPVEYAANTEWTAITYDENAGKVLIAYADNGDSDHGKAIVGTVSGTSISFGSASEFYGDAATSKIDVTYDSNAQKSLITYVGSSRIRSRVATISGTSVSFGTENDWLSNTSENLTTTFDSSQNKIVCFYIDNSQSEHGYARVGTISGTTVSFGSEVEFENAQVTFLKSVYDPDQQKVVCAYNAGSRRIIVGTVSGTSISFGSPLVNAQTFGNVSMTYHTGANKIIIFGAGNSDGRVVPVSVVGTSATITDSEATVASYDTTKSRIAYDANAERVVLAHKNDSNSTGAAIAYTPAFTRVNLTANNFLGFSDAAYSDGQTAKIQIAGSVDDAQSGLTTAKKHYVQTDGTLSTTADNPSVEAGVGISTTQIIVLG